jgi:hypothetical protein
MTLSVGSLLVGVAVMLVTVVYVARPFRRGEVKADRAVEAWVQRARSDLDVPTADEPSPVVEPATPVVVGGAPHADAPVNFCPYCGRRVEPDHRFCPGCGKPLPEDSAGEVAA